MLWKDKKFYTDLKDLMERKEPIYFCDTETSGLSEKTCDLLQVAIIKTIPKGDTSFEILDSINVFIKGVVIGAAAAVNGITQVFLDENGMEKEGAYKVIKAFFGENPIFGAYNAKFDLKFVNALYERFGDSFNPKEVIDPLVIARKVIEKAKVENHKLITIADYYGIGEGVAFHDARDDISVTIQVMECLMRDIVKEIGEKNETEKRLEEILGHTTTKKKPNITSINHWCKSVAKKLDRLYVETDCGKFYFDLPSATWVLPSADKENTVDMEWFQNEVFQLFKVNSAEELVSLIRKKVKPEMIVYRYWCRNDGSDERLYVNTEISDVYYSLALKTWKPVEKNDKMFCTLNTNYIMKHMFKETGTKTEEDMIAALRELGSGVA